MAFGQKCTRTCSWGVAPGYDDDGLRPEEARVNDLLCTATGRCLRLR